MLQPKGLQQRGRLNQRFFPGTGLMLSNGLAKLVAHGIERIESIPASLRNIAISFPRIRLNSRSRQPNNSRPLRRIEPVTRAEAGSSPSAANSRTLFPLPVSPTTARRSPVAYCKCRIAHRLRLSPKRMETPSISSIGFLLSASSPRRALTVIAQQHKPKHKRPRCTGWAAHTTNRSR